jgi:hypothetical protein
MANPTAPSYGEPNWDMVGRWLHLAPEEDGPFWALNLMKYREAAVYADGSDRGLSGQEADDAYAPLGPLGAVGAMVAFHGEVTEQALGEPAWDRIAIVRYPTRAAFFAMQQRDDFKAQHEHKEAGMAFTIVMACHPATHAESAARDSSLVLTVEPAGSEPMVVPPGVIPVVTFSVEGVIVGDERAFARTRFDRVPDGARAALAAAAPDGSHQVVVAPDRERLVESIVAPVAEGR